MTQRTLAHKGIPGVPGHGLFRCNANAERLGKSHLYNLITAKIVFSSSEEFVVIQQIDKPGMFGLVESLVTKVTLWGVHGAEDLHCSSTQTRDHLTPELPKPKQKLDVSCKHNAKNGRLIERRVTLARNFLSFLTSSPNP